MDDGAGHPYVLTNLAMPGLVKIGCTAGSVQDRIRELGAATGVPLPVECHFAARVPDMFAKERTLHQLFGDQRVNPKREFFRIAPEKIVLAISMGSFTEVTPGKLVSDPAEDRALERAIEADTKRRSATNLAAIGILPGAQLTLSRDETIVAIVRADNKVDFAGRTMSLSAAALEALHRLGYTLSAASGSDYWMHDGDTLAEIRLRKEAESVSEPETGSTE